MGITAPIPWDCGEKSVIELSVRLMLPDTKEAPTVVAMMAVGIARKS